MDTSDLLQALTLWYVVMLFVQTADGPGGPLSAVLGLVSYVLLWALPAYVVLGAVYLFAGE